MFSVEHDFAIGGDSLAESLRSFHSSLVDPLFFGGWVCLGFSLGGWVGRCSLGGASWGWCFTCCCSLCSFVACPSPSSPSSWFCSPSFWSSSSSCAFDFSPFVAFGSPCGRLPLFFFLRRLLSLLVSLLFLSLRALIFPYPSSLALSSAPPSVASVTPSFSVASWSTPSVVSSSLAPISFAILHYPEYLILYNITLNT